jgi:hypothetical protein
MSECRCKPCLSCGSKHWCDVSADHSKTVGRVRVGGTCPPTFAEITEAGEIRALPRPGAA